MTRSPEEPILHARLPLLPWMEEKTRRLPGIQPLDGAWREVDEVFAAQMAERDRLVAQSPGRVIGALPEAGAAVQELYAMVLEDLARDPAYICTDEQITRPDGVVVALEPGAPLRTLARLVQEDLCLMQGGTGPEAGQEHVLTAAALCFPASWTLAEKLGRPLVRIHRPVTEYGPDTARRVQRLFDAIRPGAGLWRMNFNTYADAALFQPRSETLPRRIRPKEERQNPVYVRCERQCLIRLPVSGAVLFSIHTYLVRAASLPSEALDRLIAEQEARHLHGAPEAGAGRAE